MSAVTPALTAECSYGLYLLSTRPSGLGLSINAARPAMDLLTDNPNGAFPFVVQGDNGNNHIVAGGHYCLHTNVIPPFGFDNVHVSQMNTTSFTFTAEAGHIEGEGATVSFSTHLDSSCNLILTPHAHGPDFGWWGGFGAVNDRRSSAARKLWHTQADRLKAEMKANGGHDPYSW